MKILFIFLSAIILSKTLSFIFNKLTPKLQDSETFIIIKNSQRIIIFAIALIMLLTQLGVDVKTITVGIGITGFAVGFALKDFFANIVSGIMILLYSPFELGDEIEINKIQGKVINLNLRFVSLKEDNYIHLIPNSWFLNYNVKIKK
jgi:small-conductance mechanosensitive channel